MTPEKKEIRIRNAQIFKALSHPIRLHMVELLLEDERCVNDIKDLFNVTQPNISQHLNILKYSGIVNYRQQGNLRCYFLTKRDLINKIIQAVK
ncbi:MAG: winged helix-turn-helix transcriptional regulator [Candidatus Aminicenantes bacterium]|nr:winged helix-turn-helix transcriptional regulator [Candidatus Aminicenantes bacterium]